MTAAERKAAERAAIDAKLRARLGCAPPTVKPGKSPYNQAKVAAKTARRDGPKPTLWRSKIISAVSALWFGGVAGAAQMPDGWLQIVAVMALSFFCGVIAYDRIRYHREGKI